MPCSRLLRSLSYCSLNTKSLLFVPSLQFEVYSGGVPMSEHIDDASVAAEKQSVKGGKMPAIGSQIGARTSSGLTPQSRNKRPHQKGGREEEPRRDETRQEARTLQNTRRPLRNGYNTADTQETVTDIRRQLDQHIEQR